MNVVDIGLSQLGNFFFFLFTLWDTLLVYITFRSGMVILDFTAAVGLFLRCLPYIVEQ